MSELLVSEARINELVALTRQSALDGGDALSVRDAIRTAIREAGETAAKVAYLYLLDEVSAEQADKVRAEIRRHLP